LRGQVWFRGIVQEVPEGFPHIPRALSDKIFLEMDRKRDPVKICMTAAADEQEPFLGIRTYRHTLFRNNQVENQMR
jgi:hypothetical protein